MSTPKYAKLVEGADGLSLGVSIVVAILLGVGAGYLMKSSFGYDWLLWLGVFWGVSAAILNVYKAYKKQVASYEEFKEVLETKGGFIYAHWDGTAETEEKIKNETKATIRCIPLDAKEEEGQCMVTGKSSKRKVLFAKAY